jgi:hypothetical protein
MSAPTDQIVELDLGIRPEAAVSGAVLVHTERSTFLTFNAKRTTDRVGPQGRPCLEDAGTAVVEFKRCLLTRFGYPNDEARWAIPRFKGVAYGIYEVRNSSWIKEVVQMNRHAFPNTKDDYISKHYLFAFHDDTFECLADDLSLEMVNEPYEAVFDRIRGRVVAE